MRTQFFRLVTLAIAFALVLAGAETVVRIRYGAPPPPPPADEGRPVLQEPDPELGWRNKAGRVEWPGRAADAGMSIQFTFWPDGLRATAPERQQGRPQVVVLGGSYTQGWAISDDETYAWKLQAAFPTHEFLNFGTAGYGTYQSLLALERHLARSRQPPQLVVYGMIDHHAIRNVAPAGWLHLLTSVTRAGPLTVPFVTLGADGKLERHRPEGIRRWPLTRQLASFALLEDRLIQLRTRARNEQAIEATGALLLELQRITREHGAGLLVVMLEGTPLVRRELGGVHAEPWNRASRLHAPAPVPDAGGGLRTPRSPRQRPLGELHLAAAGVESHRRSESGRGRPRFGYHVRPVSG